GGSRPADTLGATSPPPPTVRPYPTGDLASNLVGFTTMNNVGDVTGHAGIEQSFNALLAGRDGRQEVETGAGGQQIPVTAGKSQSMVPGSNVRLTIVSTLQWEAQQAGARQSRLTKAPNGPVVVMEPSRGRISALPQSPTSQPSHITSLAATVDLPVSAIFPPGSTAKVITAAAALEH